MGHGFQDTTGYLLMQMQLIMFGYGTYQTTNQTRPLCNRTCLRLPVFVRWTPRCFVKPVFQLLMYIVLSLFFHSTYILGV